MSCLSGGRQGMRSVQVRAGCVVAPNTIYQIGEEERTGQGQGKVGSEVSAE